MNSQPVALLGEAPPRVLVHPGGARANSWQDVVDLAAMGGTDLLGWQEQVFETSLGERSDGTWAAKRVGVSIARQNGKTEILIWRSFGGALVFNERRIVISAHQQDTARETFEKMMEVIEKDENQWLRNRIPRNGIMNAFGRESIRFTNGSKVKFKARSGAGGKGFSSDCLLLDEAQILGSRAWTSINSTMSARENPQVWLVGTPPQEEDDCYTFDSVRRSAINGESTSTAWIEWSADKTSPDYDPASEYTRWTANPSWNAFINHDVVQGEFETYTKEKFEQDRLGIWADDAGASRLITPLQWDETAVSEPPGAGARAFAIAFSADGLRQTLAGAVRTDHGAHVELIDAFSGRTDAGVSAVADWLADRWKTTSMIALLGGSGSQALADALLKRRVPARVVHIMGTREYFAANALFLDAIRDRSVTHPVSPTDDALERSVSVCDKEKRGRDGSWGWAASTSDGDETPMEAVSAAFWAVRTSKRRPRGNGDGKGMYVL